LNRRGEEDREGEANTASTTEKTVNWTRGMLRVWALLSVLWIAGAIALSLSNPWRVVQTLRNPTAEEVAQCLQTRNNSTYDKMKAPAVAETDWGNDPVQRAKPAEAAQPAADWGNDPVQKAPSRGCTDPFVELPTLLDRIVEARFYLLAAVGVPVLVLLLGFSVRWAAAGFRNSQPKIKLDS
jgi:hypothetical protein